MNKLRRFINFGFLATILFSSFAVMAAHHEKAKMDSQDKKAVLITGASSGIGARMTEVLSNNGFIVYATARKKADLDRLEAMPNVEAIKLDVTKQEEIDAAVDVVKKKGRGLYGLVNNAGIAIIGPLIETPVSELDWLFEVNVMGPYRVTQAFAPMIIQSKGRITTTGSISGILAGNLFGPYSMSKHAIEAYTDALAVEMKRFDVKVSVIEPGNYESKIGDTLRKRVKEGNYFSEDSAYAEDINRMTAQQEDRPSGKDPLEVAQALLHFMSSDSPKTRYMVTPNAGQAAYTIRQAMKEMLQLNYGHTHSLSREDLDKMMDEVMTELP